MGSIINERTSNDGMARAKLLKLLNELKNLVVPPKTISNSDLIDYIQLIQEIIMDDFPEEETRRMCFKAIDSIEKSVINAGEEAGDIEALDSFRCATEKWREWVEIFDNDYVRPLRNPSTDPAYCTDEAIFYRCSHNYKEAEATIRAFNSPEQSAYGKTLANRIIVSKIKELLDGLQGIITSEQAKRIEGVLNDNFVFPCEQSDRNLETPFNLRVRLHS